MEQTWDVKTRGGNDDPRGRRNGAGAEEEVL
jgi:hypothetical protein